MYCDVICAHCMFAAIEILQSDWTAIFCSCTNPGIWQAPDLPFFAKVGLHPTMQTHFFKFYFLSIKLSY